MRSITRPLVLVLCLSATLPPGHAQEPAAKSGVRLVYDLPGQDISKAMSDRPGSKLEDIVNQTVGSIRKRLGEQTKVEQRGATTFTVAAGDAAEVEALRRRIEQRGTLEMRMLATDDAKGEDGSRRFDLAKEKQRLQDWLDQGGRELVLQDPRAIDRFLGDTNAGPLAGRKLCWFVHVIKPRGDGAAWDYAMAMVSHVGAVLVNDTRDWNGGTVPDPVRKLPQERRRLLELVPVDMEEAHFDNRDIDTGQVQVGAGHAGPVVQYRLRADRQKAYGDWSEKHINRHSVILLNDQMLSAPVFKSRIPGIGIIDGDFTWDDAKALAQALKTDPVPVTPVLLKQEAMDRR